MLQTREVISTFIEEYEKNKNLDKSSIVFDISGVLVTEKEAMEEILPSTTEGQHRKIADYIRAWGIEDVVLGSDWLYCSPATYIS
ncbi:MAG: hypothetical protein GX341_07100 [Firmicutes bacterium]|nr:hypothetical protein [Bacillota bacterium]